MIELTDFGKDYGDFMAVERLNLTIKAGEMFGFIGPNGAGKSTTIRFLATLLKASRGEGVVNGYSVTRDPMNVRRSVGYMPDTFGVYDGMKVWEFLDFFAVAYSIGRSKRKQVIVDVLSWGAGRADRAHIRLRPGRRRRDRRDPRPRDPARRHRPHAQAAGLSIGGRARWVVRLNPARLATR